MNAVITAGGRIDTGYAKLAGSQIKALAPIGDSTMLDRVLEAARGAGIARIAVVGGEEVRSHCGRRVDRFIVEGSSGSQNVLRALGAWEDREPLLYLTSDMPFVTADALRDFVRRVPLDTIAMPISTHRAFVQRFPQAPPYGVSLGGERVVNGGAFVLPAWSARDIAHIATRFFEARKAPWRMATLVGPSFLLRFAIGRLGIAALEAEASRVLGWATLAVRDAAPELGYDADTLAEYRYARDRA